MTNFTLVSRRTILAMPLALAACKQRRQMIEIVGLSMGTTYKVVAVDHSNALKIKAVEGAVETALREVNNSLSNWDESSEISRFNVQRAGLATSPSRDLAVVMQAAHDVNLASDGRFDTTIGPLIELWGFGAQGATSMPTTEEIVLARSKSSHANTLRFGAGKLEKTQDDAQIYLAAIGKGYGADRVGQALESFGLTDYMVEIGGDLYTSGRNPDGVAWQIGIETPNAADRGVIGVIGVSGKGLASSGDYRNYFEKDGTRYSHLIDPVTGRPITHKTASATVIAENAMLADAWATAMLILGRERGLEIAAREGVAVQFVDRNAPSSATRFETHASEAFKALAA